MKLLEPLSVSHESGRRQAQSSRSEIEPEIAAAVRSGLATFALALLPTLIAIWAVPWFVTQDGPSHLYNTQILTALLKPSSPFHEVYAIRRSFFPNWGGSLVLMGLMAVLPARAADRMMMSASFVLFAASIVWLRWCIAGWRGMPIVALLAAVIALNVLWLLGFANFLLGACLFPITLGLWWWRRERLGPGLALVLAALLVLGYLFHLVSMGLTAIGLAVLAAVTPGPGRRARCGWTLASFLPLVPLAWIYREQTRDSGGFRAEWWVLSNPWSLRSWATQLSWTDPISLTGRAKMPFVAAESVWYHGVAPVAWLGLGVGLVLAAGFCARWRHADLRSLASVRRGWLLLACLLLVGGVVAPDTIGPGAYLPHRITLLGLVALVPYVELQLAHWAKRLAGAILTVALVLQSAFLWDYALCSNHLAGAYMEAKPAVGEHRRVGNLIARCALATSHRANPLLHIGSMMGVDTGNIVWDNYEPLLPHFPVQFRTEAARELTREFLPVSCYDGGTNDLTPRLARWIEVSERHHNEIDVLVVRGARPELEHTIDPWFQVVFQIENVRVLENRSVHHY
jgi:hypothetical protein